MAFDKVHSDLMMLLKSNELGKKLLDMNQHCMELVKYLEEIAQHPELILDPAHQVFPLEPHLYDDSKTNHRNHPKYVPVRTRLYKKDDFDQLVLDLVKSAAASMAKKCAHIWQTNFQEGNCGLQVKSRNKY